MFRFWYKNFAHIPVNHVDFHRAKLIYHLLLFVCILAFVVTALNLFLFDAADIAFIDAIGLLLSLAIYFYFRVTGNVTVAGWAVTLVFVGVLAAFLAIWGGNNFGIIWATLIPPIAYFLLGRSMGTLITVLFFSYALFIVYGHVEAGVEYRLSLGGFFNVLEVMVAHIMLFRFYERTRADALVQLQRNREQLQVLASTDKLTGLSNRQQFDRELHELVERAERGDGSFALLLIDVDHFKFINDRHGHLFGDKVLRELAHLLTANLRKDDSLARWGGEEFALLMPNVSFTFALSFAERLRKTVEHAQLTDQSVTVSGGVASWQQGLTAEDVIGLADRGLYQAKLSGRNRIEHVDD